MATTANNEGVTFTTVASLRLSIDDINRSAKDRWDTIFADSECAKRTTQPFLVNSSLVPDDSQSTTFEFRGVLLA